MSKMTIQKARRIMDNAPYEIQKAMQTILHKNHKLHTKYYEQRTKEQLITEFHLEKILEDLRGQE